MTEPIAGAKVRFRPITAADLPAAHDLSLAVKWPHRREDWEFVLNLGTGIAAEDDTGLLGTALHWKYGDAHASLGMVIVSPDRHGGVPSVWWDLAEEFAARGHAVLVIAGQAIPINVSPNTAIDVAGLGRVELNKQGVSESQKINRIDGLRITLNTAQAGLPVGAVIEFAIAATQMTTA